MHVKLFQRGQHSLFGEILDWMLTPLLLLVPVSIGVTWLVAQGIANAPFDRALEYNVQTLARLVAVRQGQWQFLLPPPAREILRGDEADRVYYQVLDGHGRLLSGEADLPPPGTDEPPVVGVVYLRSAFMRGQPVRVAALWIDAAAAGAEGADGAAPPVSPAPAVVGLVGDAVPAADGSASASASASGSGSGSGSSGHAGASGDAAAARSAGGGPALIQMAETRAKQSLLAAEIIKGVLLPQFAILPLAVLLIWLALVRGIKPLSVVEARIRERHPDDLSPLDESGVPMEVVPLVSSVNELLRKLKDSMATQKRFLADAAHQLKTPLAGLRMQADLAQRADASADDLKQSLKQIGRASVRATHTVNQLLALARAEGGDSVRLRQPCDLARLTIEVVREAVPRAIEKALDLGYDGAQPGAPGVVVEGNPTLLREMVRNLVDNAIAYTPSSHGRPGVITARVLADPFGRVALLQVEDSGPGIAEGERELVFEPFYRVLGNEADGSGLGLSIVREIAGQHRAGVAIEDAHPGCQPPGTRFSVRFETGPA